MLLSLFPVAINPKYETNDHLSNTGVVHSKKSMDPLKPASVHYKKVKVKGTFTLEQATKTQRGSRGIDLLFL
jgi:hypothetical protein